jgi:hypothetical protein
MAVPSSPVFYEASSLDGFVIEGHTFGPDEVQIWCLAPGSSSS